MIQWPDNLIYLYTGDLSRVLLPVEQTSSASLRETRSRDWSHSGCHTQANECLDLVQVNHQRLSDQRLPSLNSHHATDSHCAPNRIRTKHGRTLFPPPTRTRTKHPGGKNRQKAHWQTTKLGNEEEQRAPETASDIATTTAVPVHMLPAGHRKKRQADVTENRSTESKHLHLTHPLQPRRKS